MKKLNFIFIFILALQFQVYSVNADDFDLKEEKVTLFASKRSGDSFNPTKSKYDVKKMMEKGFVDAELNIFTYDEVQGKFIPVINEMEVKPGSSFSVSFTQSSAKNMHLYVYAIDQMGLVVPIFPVKKATDMNSKNPVHQGMTYTIPAKSGTWMNFGKTGTYHIFAFVSKEKSPKLELPKVRHRSVLIDTVKEWTKNSEKDIFSITVKDKFKIEKGKDSGELYSNVIGFKEKYAEYFKIHVK